MDQEKGRIQEALQKAEKTNDERLEKEIKKERNHLTRYVETILSHTAEERYEKMIEIQKKELETYKRLYEEGKSTGNAAGTYLANLQNDLDEMISNKESYIANFEEEKEKWESMSEEERNNAIEKQALEEAKEFLNREIQERRYNHVYDNVSEDTREAMVVVHDMTEKQLYKKQDIKINLQTILLSAGMGGTVTGLFGGIAEQSINIGGEAALAGSAFTAIAAGLVLAAFKGVGRIKARKMIKQYPESVNLLKELGIYDIVMEYVATENGIDFDELNETLNIEEGRSL